MPDLVLRRTDDDHLRQAFGLAEAFVTVGERSPHTRAAYRLDLTGCSKTPAACRHLHSSDHLAVAWLPWCVNHDIAPLGRIRPAVVQAWIADLGGSEHSRARRLSAVSSWYRWLVREEIVTRNPCDLDPKQRPKSAAQAQQESTTAVPTAVQVDAVLAAADVDPNPSASPVFHLLAMTGARLDEVLAADVDAIRWQQDRAYLHVIGKGRRERDLPLPAPVLDRLTAHISTRRAAGNLPTRTVGARGTEPLLVGLNGRRLTRSTVQSMLTRLARKAGIGPIADQLTPHSLRHGYATDLLAAGVPVRDVQYALGHADPRTTERYDRARMDPARHPTYRRAAQLTAGAATVG
ncbi:MAG TPA: tyrosine-type recombinase/integrase [Rugosimonospora sp.]|nr:tyrosine-type recombinase/integrase [Rugosimonospora sp.]